MPLQKTEAIVLKTQRSGETSKIITLFTPKSGRLRVVAKGSRGLKSRFFGTLEPLNHIAIVYYFKETREHQYLSQADIINSHEQIKADLKKYALANVLCELVDRTELAQPNPYLFQILLDALGGINDGQTHLNNYLYWFLLRFLKINGFDPDFSRCRNCHTQTASGMVRYSLSNGGFYCERCPISEPAGVTVSAATIQSLAKMKTISVKNVESISFSAQSEAETLLLAYLYFHIEEAKHLNAWKFYRQMQAQNSDAANDRKL